jgi:cbb3-type cytochrome oxidase maturation protein
MSISYLLVLLGLGLLAGAIWALFWAIDDGQYDDLERHGSLPLDEADAAPPPVADDQTKVRQPNLT